MLGDIVALSQSSCKVGVRSVHTFKHDLVEFKGSSGIFVVPQMNGNEVLMLQDQGDKSTR